MIPVPGADVTFETYAEVDVADLNGRPFRLQFPIECGPRVVDADLPVVGRFRTERLALEYVGFEGRPWVPTAFQLPGRDLAGIHTDRLPSYPVGMEFAPIDRNQHASGRLMRPGDYRVVQRGDPALVEVYGEGVLGRMERAADDLQAAVGRRFIVSGGLTYAQTRFPTWLVDPACGEVRLEAPVHACAPDRHLCKFGVTRLEQACAFLSAIRDVKWPMPRVIGIVDELDESYDERDDVAQICIAANAYLGKVLGELVSGMPAHFVRAWRDLLEIESVVEAGEAWRASGMLPHLLGLMDHAEAVGHVDPRRAGPNWANLRTRLVSVEGVMPSVPDAPEGPRP